MHGNRLITLSWMALAALRAPAAETPAAGIPAAGILAAKPPAAGLTFVANDGQWAGETRFLSRGGRLPARLEADGVSLLLRDLEARRGLCVRMGLDSPSAPSSPQGIGQRRERYNFLLGSDRDCWASGVAAYERVVYRDAGAGIDVVFREGPESALEYDVVVRPGGDLEGFAVRWEGIEAMRLDADGALILQTALGELRQPPPITWQEAPGGRRLPVECRYRLLEGNRCGFEAELAHPGLTLVIDPVVEWARRLGGAAPEGGDFVHLVRADGEDLLIGGATYWGATMFPGAWQQVAPGVLFDLSTTGQGDDFVGALDGETGDVLWLTFLGGSKGDYGVYDLARNAAGEILLAGSTESPDLPVTNGSVFRGGPGSLFRGINDAYVATVTSDGRSLTYLTYLGGAAGGEYIHNIAPDGGAIVVSGATDAADFPITPGAFQATFGDPQENRFVHDSFLARLDPGAGPDLGSQLTYSTFLGGSGPDFLGFVGQGMAVLPDGSVALASITESRNYPTTTNALQRTYGGGERDGAFTILRPDPGLSPAEQLVYSTYWGGTGQEGFAGMAARADGSFWFAAFADRTDVRTTSNAYQRQSQGGFDAFLVNLDPQASTPEDQLRYASYLGGQGGDYHNALAVDAAGVITSTGGTRSADFPLTSGSFSTPKGDAAPLGYTFVTRLDPSLPPAEQLVASTVIGNGQVQNEFYDITLRPGGQVVMAGQTGPITGTLPGFPRFTAPPALDSFKGLVFSLDFCDPRAVISASGSPAAGMSFSAFDSTTPEGTAITEVEWDFGDGATATGVDVSHSFGAGRHLVTLTVRNDRGCHGTATLLLEPIACPVGDASPWLETDVGAEAPAFAGSARLEGAGEDEELAVCAGGAGLTSREDRFHLVHRVLEGDGAFTARLEDLTGGALGARAGITLRESLDPGARHVTLAVEKRLVAGVETLSYRVVSRSTAGGGTAVKAAPAALLPLLPDAWMRLERQGDTIAARVSATGAENSWEEIQRVSFATPLDAALQFGFAAAGNDPGAGKPFQPLQARFGSIALPEPAGGGTFRRGDANASGTVDISDAVAILGALFLGAEELRCLDAADANDDGGVDLSDAVANLGYLFLGRDSPPAPGPEACGADPTAESADLGCAASCP